MTGICIEYRDSCFVEAIILQLIDGCLGIRRVRECCCFKPYLCNHPYILSLLTQASPRPVLEGTRRLRILTAMSHVSLSILCYFDACSLPGSWPDSLINIRTGNALVVSAI